MPNHAGKYSNGQKPKLLDQVRHLCRLEHKAASTEKSYVNWSRRYILFHGKRHPLDMGAAEVTQFLTHLAVEGNVAASTQNQALAALLFLYQKVLKKDFAWACWKRCNLPPPTTRQSICSKTVPSPVQSEYGNGRAARRSK